MRKRLLERVLEGETGLERRIGLDLEQLLPSILESLKRILNSGQGDASTDPEYGLPDVRGLIRNLPDSMDDMKGAIRVSIERYEPRLRRVRVRNVTGESAHRIHFEILAELRDEEGTGRQLRFDTRLDESGRIEIAD